jgi:hypothetical protein
VTPGAPGSFGDRCIVSLLSFDPHSVVVPAERAL